MPGLLESAPKRDIGEAPSAVEDDRPRAGPGQFAGQEIKRSDAAAAADEIGRMPFRRGGDGESLAERPEDVEAVARLLARQEPGALPGDLEEELDAALVRVMDAEGAAEQGKGALRDLDHDELPRPGRPSEGRSVDREPEEIAPALDFAKAGVSLDRHGGSGGSFRPIN